MIPPELAHNLAIRYFSNYKKKETELDDPILNTNVCDLKFANPIGLAAGFDKNGKSFNGLFKSQIVSPTFVSATLLIPAIIYPISPASS